MEFERTPVGSTGQEGERIISKGVGVEAFHSHMVLHVKTWKGVESEELSQEQMWSECHAE